MHTNIYKSIITAVIIIIQKHEKFSRGTGVSIHAQLDVKIYIIFLLYYFYVCISLLLKFTKMYIIYRIE